jgi:hypothetical protein
MALNETDRGWIKNAITEALEEHSRTLLVRFRQWSPLGACVALGLFALNEWGKYVEFRTRTNDQIERLSNQIEKLSNQIGQLRAQSYASQPTNKQNQEAAKQLIADAVNSKIPLISLKTIEETGKAFAKAGATDPAAWGVALDCLQYVSFVSREPPLLQPRKDIKSLGITSWPMAIPGNHVAIGLFGEADLESSAISEMIASPINYSNVAIKPPEYIRFTLVPVPNSLSNDDILLDGRRLRSVVFKDLHIVYNGGALDMKDVWFVNCTFNIERQQPGFKLANQLLASSETSSEVTFSPDN